MIVYRMEDHNHDGPFRGENYISKQLPSDKKMKWDSHTNNFPNMENDCTVRFSYRENPTYISGTSSLTELEKWFNPFMDDLKSAGFKIAKYETNDIIFGANQVVFNHINAKFLGYVQ